MGQKVKLTSDPALAQPHAAGAKFAVVQPCVHIAYGPLFVAQLSHAAMHLTWARQLREHLTELDARIEALEVTSGGGRQVNDPDLVARLYLVGTDLAIQTVLTLQHLVLWLERLSPGGSGKEDLTARLSAVLKRLGYRQNLGEDPRYAGLCEIENLRHSIEHPTPENTHTIDVNGWDRVPLTWIASGRAAAAFDLAVKFLIEIGDFAAKAEKRRKGTTTLQVQRGIKATNPAKKAGSPKGRP